MPVAVLAETVRRHKTRESGKGREETVAVTRERVVRVTGRGEDW